MKYHKILATLVAISVSLGAFALTREVGNSSDFLNYIKSSGTAKNYDDVVLTGDIKVSVSTWSSMSAIGKNLTIRSRDGRRYTLTLSAGNTKFAVNAGFTLTLKNIIVDGGNYGRTSSNGSLITLSQGKNSTSLTQLVLDDGAVIRNVKSAGAKGAINMNNYTKLTMREGSQILDCSNTSSDGGAIYCYQGNVVVEGGTIAGCEAKGSGGAIYAYGTRSGADDNTDVINRGDVFLLGGTITNNACGVNGTASSYGGGIYLGGPGSMLNVIGGVIVSNNACKASGRTVADDVSTYLLNSDGNNYETRLKLRKDSSKYPDANLSNAWVGVRYPNVATGKESEAKDVRFGTVWAGSDVTEEECGIFHWNGNNEFSGYLSPVNNSALVWLKDRIFVLPKDSALLNEYLNNSKDHAGCEVIVELSGDCDPVESGSFITVDNNLTMKIDLKGNTLTNRYRVARGSRMEITDSSLDLSGKVVGSYPLTEDLLNDRKSDAFKNAVTLDSGSFQTAPFKEWIPENRFLVNNYSAEFPYTVTRTAWEASGNSRIADATKCLLVDVDNEVRDVSMYDHPENEIDEITFSTGDWVDRVHTNEFLHVDVFAAPAKQYEDGSFAEVGKRVLIYSSNNPNHENAEFMTSFGREDSFVWNGAKTAVGLIKLIHITKTVVGDTVSTNNIDHAYFKFRERPLEATQRELEAKGAETPQLPIYISEELLAKAGYDRVTGYESNEVNEKLDTKHENGLRTWENLVTGTPTNRILVGMAETKGEGQVLEMKITETQKNPLGDTGYKVLYDIRKSIPSVGWRRVGEVQDTPDFTIQLLDDNNKSVGAMGYYRIWTLIIPNDSPSVTNSIPCSNIIGVMEVSSVLTNTLAAVPWQAFTSAELGVATNTPINVNDYASKPHLFSNDAVQVAANGYIYQQWTLTEDKSWRGARTMTRTKIVPPSDPEEVSLTRDNAVWVTRNTAPKEKPIFLIGEYQPEAIELTIAAGENVVGGDVCTLVSNPNLRDIGINEYDWGNNPTDVDLINVPHADGSRLSLRWKNGAWGSYVLDKAARRNVWKTDFTIPVGTGFWYHRKGPAFKIRLPQDGPEKE